MHNRLATVEAALRLQDATGASHLQQIEINPEAYGVAKSSRPHIKRLRLMRKRALHGAEPAEEEEYSSTVGRKAADPPVSLSQPDIDLRCHYLQDRISSGMVSAKYYEEAVHEMVELHLAAAGRLITNQVEAAEVKLPRLPTKWKAYRKAFPSLWETINELPVKR